MKRSVERLCTRALGASTALICAAALLSAHTAGAAGVVGTGTAASCTDAALNAALAGGGLVTFNCGPAAVTIDISTRTGTKTISADTTIDGGSLITISGGNNVGVFSVNASVKFTVQNLTIAKGSADIGGGINNGGGTVTVTNSTFSGNRAGGGSFGLGGGIFSGYPVDTSSGGTVTVTNSTFSGNSAGADGAGGGIFSADPLTVTSSTFFGNSGSGIANEGLGASTVITNSTFSRNSAGSGGGILDDGPLTVTNCTFSGNSAANGGGISNTGADPLTVTNSTFSDNSAANQGGGIATGGGGASTVITNCTFSGNSAFNGGGISNQGGSPGTLTVTNSTFFDNSAAFGGGIITGVGESTVITNCTLSGNSASSDFGGGLNINGTVTVTNTIVANSPSGGNCSGNANAVIDGGHNLDDGTTCGFTGTSCTKTSGSSFCNTNPQLAAGLATNGGPTQTIALQMDSPAINAGDESVCAAPPVNNLDQRGFVRPGTGSVNCSIGAYEYNYPLPGTSDCCQCPASCAALINGSCGSCSVVFNAACEAGSLCVLHTPSPTLRPTPSLTPTLTPSPTRTPTITPSLTPTLGATNACCQCADFCAAPIDGTCGGCTVVLGASCTSGSLCISRTPLPTMTVTRTVTATFTPSATPTNTPTRTPIYTPSLTPPPTQTLIATPTDRPTPTVAPQGTPTPTTTTATATPTITPTAPSPLVVKGTCMEPGPQGLIPCTAGTVVTAYVCTDPSCAAATVIALEVTQTDRNGQFVFVLDAAQVAGKRLVFDATIVQAGGAPTTRGHAAGDTPVDYRIIDFGPVSGQPSLAPMIDPSSAAATQLLEQNGGLQNFTDTGIEKVIDAVRTANQNVTFAGQSADIAVLLATQTASNAPAVQQAIQSARTCAVGDCNQDGQVTVDKVLTMVNIALGNSALSTCTAGDANGDGEITIDEILLAVINVLNGCADR